MNTYSIKCNNINTNTKQSSSHPIGKSNTAV